MTTATARRTLPWDTIGVSLDRTANPQRTWTVAEALHEAHADFTVDKAPLTASILGPDGVTSVPLTEKVATYRTDTNDILGVVGKGYGVIQNVDIFSCVDGIGSQSGGRITAAGQRKGGSQVFVTTKLPDTVTFIDGADEVDFYLHAMTSHDGTGSLRIMVTPIRLDCTNQIPLVIRTAKSSITIRHTSNAKVQRQAVMDTLGLSYTYIDAFQQEVQRMIEQEVHLGGLIRLSDMVLGKPEKGASDLTVRRYAERQDTLQVLWNAPHNATVKNTAWGALNVLGEYVDWAAPVRAKAGEKAERQAARILDANDRVKAKAQALLPALV
jgi:phage/plasmid-like protein (TIGR03299 family)